MPMYVYLRIIIYLISTIKVPDLATGVVSYPVLHHQLHPLLHFELSFVTKWDNHVLHDIDTMCGFRILLNLACMTHGRTYSAEYLDIPMRTRHYARCANENVLVNIQIVLLYMYNVKTYLAYFFPRGFQNCGVPTGQGPWLARFPLRFSPCATVTIIMTGAPIRSR